MQSCRVDRLHPQSDAPWQEMRGIGDRVRSAQVEAAAGLDLQDDGALAGIAGCVVGDSRGLLQGVVRKGELVKGQAGAWEQRLGNAAGGGDLFGEWQLRDHVHEVSAVVLSLIGLNDPVDALDELAVRWGELLSVAGVLTQLGVDCKPEIRIGNQLGHALAPGFRGRGLHAVLGRRAVPALPTAQGRAKVALAREGATLAFVDLGDIPGEGAVAITGCAGQAGIEVQGEVGQIGFDSCVLLVVIERLGDEPGILEALVIDLAGFQVDDMGSST